MDNLSYPDDELRARISEQNPDAQLLDGFDEAIIGVVEMFGRPPVVCYDKDLVLDTITESGEDGQETFECILGGNSDENAPVFLTRMGVND
jgi:hypothetical protein